MPPEWWGWTMTTPSDGGGAAPPQQWYDALEGITPEERGWVQNKKYESPLEALRATRGMEKILGGPRERLLRLPESDDAPEWGEIFGRMGRPEKPEDYGIEGADVELLQQAHAAGLSKRQVGKLAEYLAGRAKTAQEKADGEYDTAAQADEDSLKREWGPEFENNLRVAGQLAGRVKVALGMDDDQWKATAEKLTRAMGVANSLKMFVLLGRGAGEHRFVGSETASTGFGENTPAAAKARYDAKLADPDFRKRYTSQDKTVRLAAVRELSELAKVAFPDEAA